LIRLRAISYILGQFILLLALSMLVPIAVGLAAGDDLGGLIASLVPTAGCGAALFYAGDRPVQDLSAHEGLLLVTTSWVAVCFFGSFPFYWSPWFGTFTDAWFESTSGFSTTGASILRDVEALSASIQFWRCFSHWLGGMGIVMLGIAILPLIGVGGSALYRAQFAKSQADSIRPRVIETARALWRVYLAFTIFMALWLRLAGMSWFDAVCHTFAALGTGGFSTKNASIAAYRSPLIEYSIVVFLLLASINFTLHYRLVETRDWRAFLRDPELRFHLAINAISTLLIASYLWHDPGYGPELGFRRSLFQVVSINTTTGFATDAFEKWHPFAQLLLVALMYVGGNTGSTSGGFKSFRMVLLGRVVYRELVRKVHPRGVVAVRVGGQIIPDTAVHGLLDLIQLALVFNFSACVLMTAAGGDIVTAISGVAATMFGVGPGLGSIGATGNYAHLPALVKWVLTVCMIVGRVEFYTALVVFHPVFWRR
jgi:trk system potassium uptake protein TrkH